MITSLAHRGLPLKDARVLLLGLAYKADTGDTRNAPALTIANLLIAQGARVQIVDPHVEEPFDLDRHADVAQLTAPNLEAADAVVLLTDHTAFDLRLVERHAPYILDCRARLSGPNVERL
ncbi:UDP binding domain-containing protein [Streptomyces sp. NPDC050564]|uniref:UDP binding domain-containing protein n=1 Tax=Streptomyces sp. NPDC050564 TaxID=3365631 RepID=UPI00378D3446